MNISFRSGPADGSIAVGCQPDFWGDYGSREHELYNGCE